MSNGMTTIEQDIAVYRSLLRACRVAFHHFLFGYTEAGERMAVDLMDRITAEIDPPDSDTAMVPVFLGYSGPKRAHWHDHDEKPQDDEPVRELWDMLHATCVPIYTPGSRGAVAP